MTEGNSGQVRESTSGRSHLGGAQISLEKVWPLSPPESKQVQWFGQAGASLELLSQWEGAGSGAQVTSIWGVGME